MTTTEFCECTGLTPREVQNWLESGLLEADEMVGIPGGRREFTAEQAARARVLKILHDKGVKLSQLARVANIAFDSQAFIVCDGQDLRVCRDAAAAIATVVKAKQRAGRSICPRSAQYPRNKPMPEGQPEHSLCGAQPEVSQFSDSYAGGRSPKKKINRQRVSGRRVGRMQFAACLPTGANVSKGEHNASQNTQRTLCLHAERVAAWRGTKPENL
jgi:DNA-binding transcriptional MerR regulator